MVAYTSCVPMPWSDGLKVWSNGFFWYLPVWAACPRYHGESHLTVALSKNIGGTTIKDVKRYCCQVCGTTSAKWLGRCPGCGGYSTLVEEIVSSKGSRGEVAGGEISLEAIDDVQMEATERFSTGNVEVDRVLGGGVVPQGYVLLGGDPGIGKSTLLLQVAAHISAASAVLYVTAEESPVQIKLRAKRLGAHPEQLYLMAEGNVHRILQAIARRNWKMVVVDSLQTIYNPELESAPGSVSQVRDVAARLMRAAKENGGQGPSIFLVGHVNKEGSMRPCA